MELPIFPPGTLAAFGLYLVRTSALVLAAPILGNTANFAGVKVALILALSFLLYSVSGAPLEGPVGPLAFGAMAMRELLIGFALAFVLQAVLVAVRLGGEMIGQEMGLSMASVVDPTTGINTPLVTQIYEGLFLVGLLAVDGHHVLIRALADSFARAPVGREGFNAAVAGGVERIFGEMFAAGLTFAAPILVLLVLVSILIGLLARAVPQLNVLETGFTLRVGVALFAMYAFAPLLAPAMESLFGSMERGLDGVLTSLGTDAMAEHDQDQRTESATPRRRQEAREQGQVPISMELVAALLLGGWTLALVFGGGGVARVFGALLASTFESLATVGTRELTAQDAAALFASASGSLAGVLGVLLFPLFLLGCLAGYGQVGFQIAPQAVAFDPARLDPAKALGRLFSARSAVRTTLALGKILVITGVLGASAWAQLDRIASLSGLEVGPALAVVGHVALQCTLSALAAIVALALLDVFFQRFQHERDLRMTKQEMKEEIKATEGDPHLKARIRRMQREIASRRMMADVPKATVVVTNPTHYAVALRYEREEGKRVGAPRVVAKGVDFVAERIKELARSSGVICYEDVALARALHAQVEIGDEIPVDLYQAVASVLAYVYRMQGLEAHAPA